jgi:hypothetical protein
MRVGFKEINKRLACGIKEEHDQAIPRPCSSSLKSLMMELTEGGHPLKHRGIIVLSYHPSTQDNERILSFLVFFLHLLTRFAPPFSEAMLLLPRNTITGSKVLTD